MGAGSTDTGTIMRGLHPVIEIKKAVKKTKNFTEFSPNVQLATMLA